MDTGQATDTARWAETALWEEYCTTRDAQLRIRLVMHYMDLAHKIAASVFRQRINNAVRFEDYLQYARVGLLESIDRFRPGGEASFETFAGYRIRGAILNGLEKSTEWAAQAAQQRRARLRERAESLGGGQSGTRSARERPTDSFVDLVDATVVLAVGYVLEESGEAIRDDSELADPYRTVQLENLRTRLKWLVDALPQRERQIVHYHYFEHMEFQAIAEVLGVSKGRISQLHARALRLVREGYNALEQFDLKL